MRRFVTVLHAVRDVVPLVLVALLVWLLVARGCGGNGVLDPSAAPPPLTPRGDLAGDEAATIELFERSSPSVVHVTTVRRVDRRGRNPFEIPAGTGTGFVWDAAGYVVTNVHVVAQGNEFRVALSNRRELPARVVGVSEAHDVAVLKVDPGEAQFRALPVGTSSDLRVGQRVFAIGNPFGLDQTLTTGVISGLGRQILSPLERPIFDVIQTDAAINPGNSGGPLLDSAGRLIGMNTAILSPSGASVGIGFAVPIDTIRRVVPEIIRTGRFLRPALGVLVASDADAASLGLDGVLVDEVLPGGGAERAGLRPTRVDERGRPLLGDLIVDVGGQRVRRREDLFRALDRRDVGQRVQVKVVRDGQEVDVEVELGAAN